MHLLSLSRSLALNRDVPQSIAVYGAGGKTTFLDRLASELAAAGAKVLRTTTTKIYRPPGGPLVLAGSLPGALLSLEKAFARDNPVVLGKRILREEKIEGIDPAWVSPLLRKTGAFILVEADGAAGKPLKGYALHEPVLPAGADIIVPVIGLGALGTRLLPVNVHRPGRLSVTAGLKEGETLDAAHLARCMRDMISRGAGQAPGAAVIPVFNQVDLLVSPAGPVKNVASALNNCPGFKQLLFTACREAEPVKFSLSVSGGIITPPVTCVILAAGTASRMGRDKLALEMAGKTVLEHTLDRINDAGIGRCIVVIRPDSPWPVRLSGRAGCDLLVNQAYATGIASSLKTGLNAVDGAAQGVIFALGDQPLVPPAVYRSLVDHYNKRLDLVTGPVFRGKRGNPVLFDRRTWPLLMKLQGDAGGRQIMAMLPEREINWIETASPEVLEDLDTPADYRKILHRSEN